MRMRSLCNKQLCDAVIGHTASVVLYVGKKGTLRYLEEGCVSEDDLRRSNAQLHDTVKVMAGIV